MTTMTALYTTKDYARLPEGFPAQLVEGQLVRDPSPVFGHQEVALEIVTRVLRRVGRGRAGMAPVDVHIDEFNVYQPDVVVYPEPVKPDGAWQQAPLPLLVVEVLSPSTASRDRDVKRVRLLDAGVEEVWLVDRLNKTIEVYDRGRYADIPRRATGTDVIASTVLEGFELIPDELFAR